MVQSEKIGYRSKLDALRRRNKESGARTGSWKSVKADPSPYFFIWNVTRFWSSPVNDHRNPASHYSHSWLCTASGSSPISDEGNSLRCVCLLQGNTSQTLWYDGYLFLKTWSVTMFLMFLKMPMPNENRLQKMLALRDRLKCTTYFRKIIKVG